MVDRQAFEFVTRQLRQLYGADAVPSWEVTPHTVDRLYAILSAASARNELARLQLDDTRARTSEYAAETHRLGGVLQFVGLGADQLSEGGKSTLRLLSATSQALGCVDATLSSLYSAIVRLQEERQQLDARCQQLDGDLERVEQLRAFFDARLGEVRKAAEAARSTEAAQDAEAKRQLQQLPYFASKRAEYASAIEQCSAHLAAVGYDERLRHAKLVQSFESAKSAPSDADQDAQWLSQFADLPPDLELAGQRVRAAREALAALKQQYSSALKNVQVGE